MFKAALLLFAGLVGLIFVFPGFTAAVSAQDNNPSECCVHVVGVDEDDVLFVREFPDHTATAIVELPPDSAELTVSHCVNLDGVSQTTEWFVSEFSQSQVGDIWCSISSEPIVYFEAGSQYPVFGKIPRGWVNASFLDVSAGSKLFISMENIARQQQLTIDPLSRPQLQPSCCYQVRNVMVDDVLVLRNSPRVASDRVGELGPSEKNLTLGHCVNQEGQSVRAQWESSLSTEGRLRNVWCQILVTGNERNDLGWVNAWFLGPDSQALSVEIESGEITPPNDQDSVQGNIQPRSVTGRSSATDISADNLTRNTSISEAQSQSSQGVDWITTTLLVLAGLVVTFSATSGRLSIPSLARDASALVFLFGLSVVLFPLSRWDFISRINGQTLVFVGIVATSISFWFELFTSYPKAKRKLKVADINQIMPAEQANAIAVGGQVAAETIEPLEATETTEPPEPSETTGPMSLEGKAAAAIVARSERVQKNGGVSGIKISSSKRVEIPIGTYSVLYDGTYTEEHGERRYRTVWRNGRQEREGYFHWDPFVAPLRSIATFSAAIGVDEFSDELSECSTGKPVLTRAEMQERASFSFEQIKAIVHNRTYREALATGERSSPRMMHRKQSFNGILTIESEHYVPLDTIKVTFTFGDDGQVYSGHYAIAADWYVGSYPQTFLQKFGGCVIGIVIIVIIAIAGIAYVVNNGG